VAGWEEDVTREADRLARLRDLDRRRKERNRQRREKRIRQRVVDRYVWATKLMADEQGWSVISDDMKLAVENDLRAQERLLRDVERIAIDERLGISGVPTNLEGRR
jgi:hypothetical protein